MNIVLVIANLNCGGAERVMSLLANHWVESGWTVTLATLGSEPPFFPIDPRVELVLLGIERPSSSSWSGLTSLFKSRKVLRTLFLEHRPQAILAFTTRVNVKVLIAASGLGVPVVISERNDPRRKPLSHIWTFLRDVWYRKAHRLVVQTPGVEQWFREQGQRDVVVIPNPVSSFGETVVEEQRRARPERPLILNVARLVPQKGQDYLVRAIALMSRRDVRLRILGDGPERVRLQQLARDLGMGDRLELPGFVADKGPHFAEATVFALSSLYEGFPNALIEAMAAGLPCVSFDCPSGPAEVIQDGKNGFLIPVGDTERFAMALERLIEDQELAQRVGQEARNVAKELSIDAIAPRWEKVLS